MFRCISSDEKVILSDILFFHYCCLSHKKLMKCKPTKLSQQIFIKCIFHGRSIQIKEIWLTTVEFLFVLYILWIWKFESMKRQNQMYFWFSYSPLVISMNFKLQCNFTSIFHVYIPQSELNWVEWTREGKAIVFILYIVGTWKCCCCK